MRTQAHTHSVVFSNNCTIFCELNIQEILKIDCSEVIFEAILCAGYITRFRVKLWDSNRRIFCLTTTNKTK